LEVLAEGFNQTSTDDVSDLLRGSSASDVGEQPAALLPDIEFVVAEEFDQVFHATGSVEDGLDLTSIASSDVGESPAGFLADGSLLGRELLSQGSTETRIEGHLCLRLVSSDDVAESAERRCDDGGGWVEKVVDEGWKESGTLDDARDGGGSTVFREVRAGPAGVAGYALVVVSDQVSEDWQKAESDFLWWSWKSS